MLPNRILMFAAENDLSELMLRLEESMALEYVRASDTPSNLMFHTWSSIADIPAVSRTDAVKVVASPYYLVSARPVRWHSYVVRQRSGGRRYYIDQSKNPNSVVIRPGGVAAHGRILAGSVDTGSSAMASITLFNAIRDQITYRFRKVQSYWVGPRALELAQEGIRLITHSRNEPVNLDLDIA